MSFCGLTKGNSPKMSVLCFRVIINKRSFLVNLFVLGFAKKNCLIAYSVSSSPFHFVLLLFVCCWSVRLCLCICPWYAHLRTLSKMNCFVYECARECLYQCVHVHAFFDLLFFSFSLSLSLPVMWCVAACFVKFDALAARFVTTWWQNVPKGPLAARFVTPSPATL